MEEAHNISEQPVEERSLKSRILAGSFWSLVANVASNAATFGALIVCARLLGKSTFGELGIARNTVGTLGIFAGMGLGLTATKCIAQYRSVDRPRAGRILALCMLTAMISSLIMSLAFASSAHYIAKTLLLDEGLHIPLVVGALLLFLFSVDSTQKGILAGFEAYKEMAWICAIGGFVVFPATLIGVKLWGLTGAMIGLSTAPALRICLNARLIPRLCARFDIPIGSKGCWRERGLLVSFSLPAFLANSIGLPSVWLGNVLLTHHHPNAYAELGVLAAADHIRQMALFIPLSALQCLLPILSSEGRSCSAARTQRLHVVNSYSLYFITSVCAALALFFVDPILAMYGKDFHTGKYAMILTICALPILAYRTGIHRLMQARGLVWWSFVITFSWALLYVGGVWYAVRFGSTGMALVFFAAYFINSTVVLPFVLPRLGMKNYLGKDLWLTAILTVALLPGLASSLLHLSLWIDAALLCLSLVVCCGAALMLKHWYYSVPESNIAVDYVDNPDANSVKVV